MGVTSVMSVVLTWLFFVSFLFTLFEMKDGMIAVLKLFLVTCATALESVDPRRELSVSKSSKTLT